MRVERNPVPGLTNSVEDMLPLLPEWEAETGRASLPMALAFLMHTAWDAWWTALTRLGDPQRRYDVTRDAFVAGFLLGAKHSGSVNRHLDQLDFEADDGLGDRGIDDGTANTGNARKRRKKAGASPGKG